MIISLICNYFHQSYENSIYKKRTPAINRHSLIIAQSQNCSILRNIDMPEHSSLRMH